MHKLFPFSEHMPYGLIAAISDHVAIKRSKGWVDGGV